MDQPTTQSETDDRYDLVIIGGAFSGAASAIMVKRWRPQTRVLLIERSERFTRKVGEATVEVSGLFITKVLGLSRTLAREHLAKQGLRFWFDHGQGQRFEDLGELGPNRLPGLASYHLDRSTFDQHLLDLAGELGVEIIRPGKVTDVQTNWPDTHLTYEPLPQTPPATSTHCPPQGPNPTTAKSPNHQIAKSRTVHCRWVIDASGRNTFLGRRMGLMEKPRTHPVAAIWSRWQNVASLDGQEVLGPDIRKPRLKQLKPERSLSTNHFCGYGWWCWLIPLPGGQASIGLVYDKRLFEPPGTGKLPQRYREFVTGIPGLSQLLSQADMEENDFNAYKDLPYRSRQMMGRGWAMVGDAAAFLDPLYSSGLDHAAISIYATARIIEDDLNADPDEAGLDEQITRHNKRFHRSYDRWLEAIYQDKYALFGDPELVAASYFLDIASYYLGVVKPVYDDLENFRYPVLGLKLPQAVLAHRLMRGLKGRFIKLADTRRRLGLTAGPDQNTSTTAQGPAPNAKNRRERARHRYPAHFELGLGAVGLFIRGLGIWIRTELTTLAYRIYALFTPVNRPVQPNTNPKKPYPVASVPSSRD